MTTQPPPGSAAADGDIWLPVVVVLTRVSLPPTITPIRTLLHAVAHQQPSPDVHQIFFVLLPQVIRARSRAGITRLGRASLRGATRRPILEQSFIAVIAQRAVGGAPDAALLRGLFDLTPAEAKVARLITQDMSTIQIGRTSNVSINTVKAHLKAVFAKTGARHRAALVALLSGLQRPVQNF